MVEHGGGNLKPWQMRDRFVRNYKLPSCGWLYGGAVPDGTVTMSALRGEDEEIIGGAGEGAAALPVLREVLERLVPLPQQAGGKPFQHKYLLFSDWLALLFNFFAFSYGSEMSFTSKCPLCKEVPAEPFTTDISDLPCTVYDEEPGLDKQTFREPFKTRPLPPYGDVIDFRLLRVEDQLAAESYYRQARQVGKTGDVVRTFATARHIVGVNGEPVTSFEAIDYVRNATTGETLATLRAEFAEREPGYYMSVPLVCPLCGGTFDVRLPEDGSFFRSVDTQHRKSQAAKVLDAKLRAGEFDVPGLGSDGPVAAE